MSTSEIVATLLQYLGTLPDVCLVIGSNDAICETFIDPSRMDFSVDGAFVTMETAPGTFTSTLPKYIRLRSLSRRTRPTAVAPR